MANKDSMKQAYMESFYPGSFVAETSVKEIKTKADAAVELISDRLEVSGMTYPDGKIHTLDELRKKRIPGKENILLDNMESNNWNRVVEHRHGGFRPLEDGDSVI